jgi:hypothetical protein
VQPYSHRLPRSKHRCDYVGGWWRWTSERGWHEETRAPIIRLDDEGIEIQGAMPDEHGRHDFLGLIPGQDAESWMLHLIRGTDPAYPTLMDQEMDWLSSVPSGDQERNRSSAESMLGSYLFAFRAMERHLVLLYGKTKLPRFKEQIAWTLRRHYDAINRDVIEPTTSKAVRSDDGVPHFRHELYHSEQGEQAVLSHKRAATLTATMLGKKSRSRPPAEEITKWTEQRMREAEWVLQRRSLCRSNHSELPIQLQPDEPFDTEARRLCGALGGPDHHIYGVTFERLWQCWLEDYLERKWDAKRPLQRGRTYPFSRARAGVLYSAALYWIGRLTYYEPDSPGLPANVAKAIRAKKGKPHQ